MQKRICYEHVIIPDDCSFLMRYDQEETINSLELHQHPELEFQFTLSGHGVRTIGGVVEPFKEMEVVFIPSNVPHTWVYDSGTRIQEYSLQFPRETIVAKLRSFPELGRIAEMVESMGTAFEILGDKASEIAELMVRMTSLPQERRFMAFIDLLLAVYECNSVRPICIDDNSKMTGRTKDKIRRVLAFMEEHLEDNLTLKLLSEEFSMGETAFCNFFKKATGKTFSFALNEMRVTKACMLLTSRPSLSIENIGYSVGYTNQSHFCHMFRRFRGCSPGEYRLRGALRE